MPGMEILFCLLGGGAGLLAVDGLELCKGAAHVSMGDEALFLYIVNCTAQKAA